MSVIKISGLTHHYGKHVALRDVDLEIPEGSLFALLGPNGSGKTTLLRILVGLLRATTGSVTVVGRDVRRLSTRDREMMTYVAEGQPLPGWMNLRELQAYLRPLYPAWDNALATSLCDRFELDPTRKLRSLSRGEQMKAALLCALAPRPKLVIMDEPFSGMDALVKDDLVRGLLATSGSESWSVLISSHDLVELETLADGVAFLDRGRLLLAEPLDAVRERIRKVDILMSSEAIAKDVVPLRDWLSYEQAGRRLSFVYVGNNPGLHEAELRFTVGAAADIDERAASLTEIFVALASARSERRSTKSKAEVAA